MTSLEAAIEEDARLRELVAQITVGDQAALATFYDATISRVYGIALRIVRQPEAAEEVASDVYLQVWREATRYDVIRGRVLGWVLIIARSRALDHLRRQEEAFTHPDPHELRTDLDRVENTPQDLLIASQASGKLHVALRTLSPVQRQLLSFAFFRGLSHSEIVEHSGLPLGTVKTHIRRALNSLRDVLEAAQ